MKRTKWKLIPLALLLAGVGTVGMSDAHPSAKALRTSLKYDIVRVNQQQREVKAVKSAFREEQPGVTRSDVFRAKAELKRDKAILKADKMALMERHGETIDAKQAALREYKTDIRAERRQLNRTLAKGDKAAIAHTENIVEAKQETKARKDAIAQAKLDRNEDLVALNQQIKEVHGQNVVVLTWENSTAKAQNLALK